MGIKKASTVIIKFISGNALSQIFLILGTPLITRVYNPNDFGVYSVILSIILILGVIGTGRYDQIMYKFQEENEWNECFNNGVIINLIVSTITLLAVIIINYHLGIPKIYLLLSPLIFTFALIQLLTSLFSLHGNYKCIIYSNILRTLTLIISQFAFFKFNSIGLILGLIFSQFMTLFFLIYIGLKSETLDYKFKWVKHGYRELIFSSVQSLSNSFSSQLPVLFIPQLYGMTLLGLYGLAMRLTQLPITFFTNAIRPYIMGELNRNINKKETVFSILWKSSASLLLLSIVGIIMISAFAESFFRVYAGDTWAYAGNIASILSIWLLVAFANVVATSYLTVNAKYLSLLLYDSVLLIMRGGVIVFSFYYEMSFTAFLYSYSLLGMIFNLGIILYAVYCGWRNTKGTNSYC
ncbi:lipopolysaccharide biosynthesis protein [Enterobacter sp.]|uniref:lipopolysaccharide biosynthesis protein n=1 Tax=Enterobacter sp. TaxID=42895 RepID=UPI00296F87F9|nr:oligosaccharide flippase family protein [Enterobacter sp.]